MKSIYKIKNLNMRTSFFFSTAVVLKFYTYIRDVCWLTQTCAALLERNILYNCYTFVFTSFLTKNLML